MRCYVGTDPGRASPVGQVRRATLAPFLYPLLFYQKSGQKSIILCVANLTNGRKNRRNTALEIVQYDEPHSARPGTLRQQESSPSRAPEAAPARHSREQQEEQQRRRGGAQQARPAAETEQRAESAPARRSSPAPEQRGRSHPAAGSRRRSRQHPEAIPGGERETVQREERGERVRS